MIVRRAGETALGTAARGGRPRKVDDADAAKAKDLKAKGLSAPDIAKMLGCSRATVYRYLSNNDPIVMHRPNRRTVLRLLRSGDLRSTIVGCKVGRRARSSEWQNTTFGQVCTHF
ncbi:helix-turn-helix domain-containing protein [Nocardia sp. NPDC005978]|uniref:helix-turn-helix domain-containing protein n=1 Tax=Nocardia sp. NPDC005978 TaxID=3156725 RepID=UPI0033A881E1